MEQLLSTKLYIPKPRPDIVSRPRLIERLNTGLYGKLTLISAPAGFGKTTLLSEWINQTDRSVAWVSLDEGDNDVVRFLTYIIAALKQIWSGIGEITLAMLQSPQLPQIESLLTELINEITEIPDGPSTDLPYDQEQDRQRGVGYSFSIILDDYHILETQSIHNAIIFLLDHLPPQMHLVLATREDPPLPLARWRAQRKMSEIRASDLRFTEVEAAVFLNHTMDLALTPEDITSLASRTEGWIAGLHLAALSLQGCDDHTDFIQSFAGDDRHVMDYLVSDVLHQKSESVQRFLLRSSILKRMSGPLCDVVVGGDKPIGDSQNVLEHLEQANLFIVPLDNRRQWYRYHHLFADLLRTCLRREQTERIPDLHRRASAWYEQNELITDALDHALAAEDFERAARLVAANALPMLIRGEVATVKDWLESLPQEIVRGHPRLCIDMAWTMYIIQRPDAIEPLLKDAEKGLESIGLTEKQAISSWLGEVMALRAWIKRSQGDLAQAIELSHEALKHLTEEHVFALCLNLVSLAGALRYVGDTAQAVQVLIDCIPICQAAGNSFGVMADTHDLAELRVMQGQLHMAKAELQDTLRWATEQGVHQMPATSMVYMKMGDVLREQNDLQSAEDHLLTSIELSKQSLAVVSGQAYLSLARLKQARGDAAAARNALRHAENAVRGWETPEIVANIAAHRARLWLAQDNLPAAVRWIQQSEILSNKEPTYLHEFELLTLARVLIAQGSVKRDDQILHGAMELLEALQQEFEAGDRMGRVMEVLMLQALALSQIPIRRQSRLDNNEALDTLKQALALAEPEGYIRMFADEGKPMAHLLYECAARGIKPEYASRLLAAFYNADATQTNYSPTEIIEPLSAREMEVLELIAEGHSNQMIAAKLNLSLNTVKVHSSNIYGKLGVNSRTQAVSKANTLGILLLS